MALALSVAMLVGFTACDKDNTEPNKDDAVSVAISVVEKGADSVTLNITGKNADEAWVYCAEEGVAVDAAAVEANGKRVTLGANITLAELTPETKYVAYAYAKRGDKSDMANVAFTTDKAEAQPFEGHMLDKLVSAIYRTDNDAVAGNYEVTFGNTTKMEWVGDIQVFIDFYNEQDDDPLNPVLPSGTYEPNSDYSAFSYNPSNSYVDIVVDGGELVSSPIVGVVTVERTGPTYTITVEGTLMLLNDMEFSARYTGTMQFVQGGTSAYEFFDEDVNITVKDAQMRYWGGWFYPFCDDVGVEMFDGSYDENGTMTRGYYLHISRVFMPKYADYNANYVPLADGLYNVYSQKLPSAHYCLPYAIEYGRRESVFGDQYFMGTYVTYVDNTTKKVAFITEGTMNVESSGKNYTITIDFVAENGIKVKASYTGELLVGNLNDNDQSKPAGPHTTLTGDHTYNIPSNAEYVAMCLGQYMKKGYDSWFMTIMAFNDEYPDGYGDMFTAEFLVEAGGARDKLPTGLYNVSMTVEDHVMFPGILDFGGNILFTWYGDLTPDAEGYSSQIAPIVSGTINVEDAGDNKLRFVFNLVDDAGNNITGEWTGGGAAYDYSSDVPAAPLKLAMRK